MKWIDAAVLIAMLFAVTPAAAADAPPNFVFAAEPRTYADIEFADEAGKPRRLAEFKGKVVLLNLWATWCGPCRKEMPALDRLQAALGGPDFEVVAVSIDRGGIDAVTKFYAEIGIEHLAKYNDSSGAINSELGTFGLPSTLLIDRDSREIGRLIGPAEWDSAESIAFIKARLGIGSGSLTPMRPGAATADRENIFSTAKGNTQ